MRVRSGRFFVRFLIDDEEGEEVDEEQAPLTNLFGIVLCSTRLESLQRA